MLKLLGLGFPHRHNANGTHDSICTVCFATVATVQYECELARLESAHVCDPINLYRASENLWRWPSDALLLRASNCPAKCAPSDVAWSEKGTCAD